MKNVFEWCPFEIDEQTSDIARKWLGNKKAEVFTNKGKLLNPIQFIKNTDESKDVKRKIKKYTNTTNIENWIFRNTEGRNNTLIKLGLFYLDSGSSFEEAYDKVLNANQKFEEPLEESEILQTIYKTMFKHNTTKIKANSH